MALRPFRIVYEALDTLKRPRKVAATACSTPEGVIRTASLWLFSGRADRAIIRLIDPGTTKLEEFARMERREGSVHFEVF